jgi:hypothetical protein
MISNNLKHNKNLKPNKTLLAIIFSLIFTMFFLSFECNLFGGGDSGGIFIPPFGGGGGSSLSNPALSITNTERSYSSIFGGSHYYLLSRSASGGTNRLIIHRIPSNFSSLSSTSFAFILSGTEKTPFPTNILDTASELITTSYVSGAGADYHSAILKINKNSLSLQQLLFFNNTEIPLILFDNLNNHIYLSLVTDSFPSQGYLLKLGTNLNIIEEYKTDTESISGYPPNIYLSSQTNSNLCLTGGAQDPSSNILNPGVIIISKSNLTTATKIPFTYSYPNTHYITSQNPLITTESDTDYVYFADAIDSHTFYINKISVPTIAPGAIASASTKISLPSSSILNININKINNQIVVGISKSESSINKLLFIILNPSDLNLIRSFELDVNNNQLFMYHYQKYHQTPDNGFILTGNLNPSSYKTFFLKFNNTFNLTENSIFTVNNSPNINITSSSYALPTIQTITLVDNTTLNPNPTLYTIQESPWTSNLSINP